MQTHNEKVNPGFTNKTFPRGIHLCQIYSDDREREEVLLQFLVSGVHSQEKTCCYTDRTSPSKMEKYFSGQNTSYQKARDTGILVVEDANIYTQNGNFDTEGLIRNLSQNYDNSINQGYRGVRVIGEMPADIMKVANATALMGYESKVSLLVQKKPMTCVCQYNARSFDGATIMDILKVHPLMLIRGTVIHNPFYVKPEDILYHLPGITHAST